MNDLLSDSLEPGDPLHRAAQILSTPVPLADGFPERLRRRRARRRRNRVLIQGLAGATMAALLTVAIRPGSTDRKVTFVLDAPASHSVALVGDFNEWRNDDIQLHPGNDGKWKVTVKLPPGRYRFAYLVDKDEWRADAAAAPTPDDYGRPTSVVTVTMEL